MLIPMIWLPGKIVRFKSDHADDEARELAERLHGRCKKTGKSEITITKTVRWIADFPPRDLMPRLEREDAAEFGSNGHAEASRVS